MRLRWVVRRRHAPMRTVDDAVTVKVVAGPVVKGHVGSNFWNQEALEVLYLVARAGGSGCVSEEMRIERSKDMMRKFAFEK